MTQFQSFPIYIASIWKAQQDVSWVGKQPRGLSRLVKYTINALAERTAVGSACTATNLGWYVG